MRTAILRLLSAGAGVGAAAFLVAGHPAKVQAQTVFCPPPFTMGINGSCVDPADKSGAFSGAAIASQALSELSETTTQQGTTNTAKAVAERREQERQRCPEGFRRVDGSCEPTAPQVTEAVPSPPKEHVAKKAKKPKTAKVVREEAVAPAPKIVHRPPPPPPPPVFAPVPIEPALRYGTWAQIYGDYQKRDAAGPGSLTCCDVLGNHIMNVVAPVALALDLESRMGTVGFLAGADLTFRDLVLADDGMIVGLTTGYVSSDLTLASSSVSTQQQGVGNGAARLRAILTGPAEGAYATYFNGGFSSDFIVRVDALTLDETFNDLLATTDKTFVPFAGGSTVGVVNTTVADNLNCIFDLYPNFWIEPTVGALYTNSSYGSGAAQLGLANGNLVRVQGGARFGTTSLLGNHILATTTLTGLAYDDVVVSGGFIPAGAFAGNNLLVQSDRGFVRGLGILALNLDYGNGITSFIQGDAYGGAHLFGAGGKAGIRYQW